MRRAAIVVLLILLPLLAHAQTATITWGTTHQTIDGFGASVGTNYGPTPTLTSAQATLFFSTTSGLGFSLLRDSVPDNGDCTTVNNGCAGDYADMQLAIPYGVKVWSTPWSPPPSMKTNGSTSACPGNGALSTGSYGAYANYLSNYITSLANLGIPLYALSVQNEPDFCATYDGALWTDTQFDTFIKTNLGPTLAAAGQSAVRVIMPESSGWGNFSSEADTCMGDSSCYNYVSINAWHDYDATYNPPNSITNPYSSLGKGFWETEVSAGSGFGPSLCGGCWDPSMADGLLWAAIIDNRMAVANANAWLYWWFITGGTPDNEGLLYNDGVTTSKRMFVIGNYSKFVRPGWVRIDATHVPVSGVTISAYKDSGSGNFAIVATNQNSSAQTVTFSLSGFSSSTVTPWLTNASNNLVQQSPIAAGSSFVATLGASSVTTFVGASSSAQLWSGVLSPARGINWAGAGIPGGLPDATWTQCGSTISASGGDDGPTIAAALASCGFNQYVQLSAGNFTSSSIHFPQNTTGHLELRGNGSNSTFINYTSGVNCNGDSYAICFNSSDETYPGGGTTTTTWTGGYTQGSTQITLGSIAGITPNLTMLVLNQCDTGYSTPSCTTGAATDNYGYFICSTPWTSPGYGCNLPMFAPDGTTWRTNAWEMEAVQVTSFCGGTCVNISQPIEHPNWSSGQSPQAVLIQPVPVDGVRDLALDGSNSGTTGGCVGGENTWQAFIYDVKCAHAYARGFYLLDSFHSFIQNDYIVAAGTNSAVYGDGMGIRISWGADDLIQNNICQQWKVCFVNDGPAPGDVIAYNFFINQLHGGSEDDYMWTATYQHATGDDFQLLEGNAGDGTNDDNIHGGHVNQTRFRNFWWGYEQCANGQCGSFSAKTTQETAIISSSTARYGANVGNVLGTPGFTNIYLNSTPFGSSQAYQLGGGNNGTTPVLPPDPLVISTGMRWDNWDAASNATVCDNSQVPTSAPTYPNSIPTLGCGGGTLPASFYLSSKPSWFGSIPWPPIGPDVDGGNVGQCAGPLNVSGQYDGLAATFGSQCTGSSLVSAWAGHVNAIPAQACAYAMGIPPDGTGPVRSFNPVGCYQSGGTPAISFSPSSFNFGTVAVGSVPPCPTNCVTITMSNPGTAPLTWTGPITVSDTTNYTIISIGGCVSPLAAGGSCMPVIQFNPMSVGSFPATLNVNGTNIGGMSYTVPFTGNGIMTGPTTLPSAPILIVGQLP